MKAGVVLITGASSGIGRETAFRFAREGWNVILTYNKGRARGEAARKRCVGLGAEDTLLINLDVADGKSVNAALKKVKAGFGKIDVLVNNAGYALFMPFLKQRAADIERQLRTNLEGLIRMTRAFLPITRKCIINVASAAGKVPFMDMATYCATKYGVRGFTQSLAEEYPRMNICAVNPDLTATRMTGYEGRPPEEVAETIFRAATGMLKCEGGDDVDVADVMA
jgi:NAD(P)-dependent dehydrogenase (short-subunit alcohol dehydrogenase family)